MTDRFLKCVEVVLRNEGGYVNDPVDPGGETKYGISKRAFPHLDIKNLTIDQAKEIYYDKYWLPLYLDAVTDINAALQIFDMGVNAGIVRSARMAQQVCGAYPDGKIGIATLMAIENDACFLPKFKLKRAEYYKNIATGDKIKFLRGWLNRVEHTKI